MLSAESFYNWLSVRASIRHYVVAYSGGLDSHVLLHLMAKLHECKELGFSLSALHVNHGLSAHADAWAQHCLSSCDVLNIPCQILTIDVSASLTCAEQGIEAAARELRYQTLIDHMPENSALLLAHHADDQAETLLLQLLRGSGIKGLASMAEETVMQQVAVLRPLLGYQQSALQVYAQQHQLQWVDDHSNHDQRYDRNYLRHAVMPLLKKRWPSLSKTFSRSARHCAEASDLLQDMLLPKLCDIMTSDKTLSISKLMLYSDAQQRAIIRAWLNELDVKMPSEIKLAQVLNEVMLARCDANPCLRWGKHSIRRYRDELYCVRVALPLDQTLSWSWSMDDQAILTLPHGRLIARVSQHGGISSSIVAQIEVRFRRGGEKIRMKEGGPCHSLKSMWQALGIPPWQRDSMPLLFYQDQLIAIPGHCISQIYYAVTDGYQIEFDHNHVVIAR